MRLRRPLPLPVGLAVILAVVGLAAAQGLPPHTTLADLLRGSAENGDIRITQSDALDPSTGRLELGPIGATLSPWRRLTVTTVSARAEFALFAAAGYVWAVGGAPSNNVTLATIERASTDAEGNLGPWADTGVSMPTPRRQFALVYAHGFLYVIGGIEGIGGSSTVVRTVDRAPLQSDGRLGQFTTLTTNPLPVPRTGHAAVYSNGFIYVIGGTNAEYQDVDTVYYAPVLGDGSLGVWQTTTEKLPQPRTLHAAVASDGQIYVVGGCASSPGDDRCTPTTRVIRASVVAPTDLATPTDRPGDIKRWYHAPDLGSSRARLAAVAAGGHVYAIGGLNGTVNVRDPLTGADTALATVERAPRFADSSLGAWETLPDALDVAPSIGLAGLGAVATNGFIYVVGGRNNTGTLSSSGVPQRAAQVATLRSEGSLNTWSGDRALPSARLGAAGVAARGNVYLIGGRDDTQDLSRVDSATATGALLGPWTAQTALNRARKLHGAVFANGRLYVVGGATSPPEPGGGDATVARSLDTVERAEATDTGALNPWTEDTSRLNTPRAALALVASHGYLYAIGGYDPAQDPSVLRSVERARINADGSLGAWMPTSQLNVARHLHGAFVVGDYLYVVGGLNDRGVDLPDVERAAISPDGELGAWSRLDTALTTPRRAFGVVATLGRVYLAGGFNGAGIGYLSATEVAQVRPDGTLSAWTPGQPLPSGLAYQALVATGDRLFALGGRNTTALLDTASSTTVNTTGATGGWQPSAGEALPTPRAALAAAAAGRQLYTAGGRTLVNRTPVVQSDVEGWQLTGTDTVLDRLPTGLPGLGSARESFGLAALRSRLYAVGGSGGSGALLDTVEASTIQPDGTLSTWTARSPLPAPRAAFGLAADDFRVYVVGGRTAAGTVGSVVVGTVDVGGADAITWANEAGALIQPRLLPAAVVAGEYVYAIGGHDGAAARRDVERARILPDGTLTAWQTEASLLAEPRMGAAAFYRNGYVYVVGGEGNTYLASVERALVRPDGTLGLWQGVSSLSQPRTRFGLAAGLGYTVAIGGENTTGALGSIEAARTEANLVPAVRYTGRFDLLPTATADASLTRLRFGASPGDGQVELRYRVSNARLTPVGGTPPAGWHGPLSPDPTGVADVQPNLIGKYVDYEVALRRRDVGPAQRPPAFDDITLEISATTPTYTRTPTPTRTPTVTTSPTPMRTATFTTPTVTDVGVSAEDIYTRPSTLLSANTVSLGATVRNNSGAESRAVTVSFERGEGSTRTPIATAVVTTIPPYAFATVEVPWTAPPADVARQSERITVKVRATTKSDANTANDIAARQVHTFPAGADYTPPDRYSVSVDEGPLATSPAITLRLTGQDASGGTGIGYVLIREIAFDPSRHQWNVIRSRGWTPYADTLSWTLSGQFGAKYLLAWFADQAGNVTTRPATTLVNYVRPNTPMVPGETHAFRFDFADGRPRLVTFTVGGEDADLFVWRVGNASAPDFYLAGVRALGEGPSVETLALDTYSPGVYHFEVQSLGLAQYTLSVAEDPGRTGVTSAGPPAGKFLPPRPLSAVGLPDTFGVDSPFVPVIRAWLPAVLAERAGGW